MVIFPAPLCTACKVRTFASAEIAGRAKKQVVTTEKAIDVCKILLITADSLAGQFLRCFTRHRLRHLRGPANPDRRLTRGLHIYHPSTVSEAVLHLHCIRAGVPLC